MIAPLAGALLAYCRCICVVFRVIGLFPTFLPSEELSLSPGEPNRWLCRSVKIRHDQAEIFPKVAKVSSVYSTSQDDGGLSACLFVELYEIIKPLFAMTKHY